MSISAKNFRIKNKMKKENNSDWNLFLDDERTPTDNTKKWIVATSSQEAKKLVIELGKPKEMSLDHDLGGDDTTMKFLHWLAEEYYNDEKHNPGGNYLTIPGYIVHSQNIIGAKNIVSYMECWKKVYNNQTTN